MVNKSFKQLLYIHLEFESVYSTTYLEKSNFFLQVDVVPTSHSILSSEITYFKVLEILSLLLLNYFSYTHIYYNR